MWATREEQLKLIRPVEYHAPTGLFDDTAAGKPGPLPLLEREDGWLRMEVFRKVLAGLVTQHVFLCCCAVVGVKLHLLHIQLPDYVRPAAAASASVVYIYMWWKATRWPSNLYLFILFTLLLGAYLMASVAGEGKHIVANLMFQFTLGWVMMLLFSLPSFTCDLSIFDIKFSGIFGYALCLLAACGTGWLAAVKITPGNIVHASIPVVAGAVYMLFALVSLRRALAYFYDDVIMAIVIYAWAFPVDTLFRSCQMTSRTYFYPL